MSANFTADGIEDPAPIPQHEFSTANRLYEFPFDDSFTVDLSCPDCGSTCLPVSLGDALDWALGHKCEPDQEAAVTAAGETED